MYGLPTIRRMNSTAPLPPGRTQRIAQVVTVMPNWVRPEEVEQPGPDRRNVFYIRKYMDHLPIDIIRHPFRGLPVEERAMDELNCSRRDAIAWLNGLLK